jgi:hypothetical protein
MAEATQPRPLPGLRRNDLAPCALCGKGLMHDGGIAAYHVRITQYIVDHNAVRQQHGLEVLLGSPHLAQVMGTDPEFLKAVSRTKHLLCQDCFLRSHTAEVWEAAQSDKATEPA